MTLDANAGHRPGRSPPSSDPAAALTAARHDPEDKGGGDGRGEVLGRASQDKGRGPCEA